MTSADIRAYRAGTKSEPLRLGRLLTVAGAILGVALFIGQIVLIIALIFG